MEKTNSCSFNFNPSATKCSPFLTFSKFELTYKWIVLRNYTSTYTVLAFCAVVFNGVNFFKNLSSSVWFQKIQVLYLLKDNITTKDKSPMYIIPDLESRWIDLDNSCNYVSVHSQSIKLLFIQYMDLISVKPPLQKKPPIKQTNKYCPETWFPGVHHFPLNSLVLNFLPAIRSRQ